MNREARRPQLRCVPPDAFGYDEVLMWRLVALLLLITGLSQAAGPVYVVLWFDTEDYIEPTSDDAALRIASDLRAEGVRATFKVVGEKARMLESRGRRDVIQALSQHAIGYHSNWHSVHPTPAEYLVTMNYLEGAAEFERREASGLADVKRIMGADVVCYGQPGSSWGPQTNLALRRMGIPVYLDEGEQVGLNGQPFWYGGLLYIFAMGRNQFRARLDAGCGGHSGLSTIRRSGSAPGGGRRRSDQHLLPPQRIRDYGVLGCGELLARRQPGAQ